MALFKAKNKLDRVFEISIILKALDGLLEMIGGILALVISPKSITSVANLLTQHELSTDPHDFIANHLLIGAKSLAAGGSVFAGVYLLSHGITKIVLVIEILRDHLWAYKAMIVFLAIFVVYQVYRMFYKPSISLALLTVFDVLIIYLTRREEVRQRKVLV